MSKRNKIIYWVATLWLALGMTSTAIVQLIPMEEEAQKMKELGYPPYFLVILGVWKLLGVIAVLIPGMPRLKEWAYAGFFFAMSGAAVSHIFMSDPAGEIFPSLLLLVLTMISWYFRPPARKALTLNHN